MDNFATWWAFCQRVENDGRSQDSAPGESFATRWGWTFGTWSDAIEWTGADPSARLFGAMTQQDAGDLAKAWFWHRLSAGSMSAGVDLSVVDWAFTSGQAVRQVQRQLGVLADGVVGPITLGALRRTTPAMLVDRVAAWRTSYFDRLGFRDKWPGLYRRTEEARQLGQQLAARSARSKVV
jgi:lysozyme family protein